MTANAHDEDVQKSRDAGMNAHLVKSVEPNVVYQEMAKQINAARRMT